jgi:hypothetical protein
LLDNDFVRKYPNKQHPTTVNTDIILCVVIINFKHIKSTEANITNAFTHHPGLVKLALPGGENSRRGALELMPR